MNPSNSIATYSRLVEIATKIEDGEAVRSIHKACVEHTNSPGSSSHQPPTQPAAPSHGRNTASDVRGVRLQKLTDKYRVDTVRLDQVIPDNKLSVIAAYFESVDLYSQAMGLNPADQADVRTTLFLCDAQTAMTRLLSIWKLHDPYRATYRALMELLLRLNRTEVAAQICQYLAQNVPPHESDQRYAPQVPYCTDSLGEDETEASSDANQEGASGFALKTNIWTGRDVLFVHFLNPEILEQEKWDNEHGVLNIGNILSWAEAWNTKKYPNIPTFKKTDRPDRADIRVKFEGGTSWSMVGRQAKAVQNISEPTMILSLKGVYIDYKMQKFLVMHEFGHALGLFHEHQRSDFWKVANSLLDVSKMKNDPRMKNVKFDRDILEKQPQDAMVMTPEYDPDSIMHYWFDVYWLKNTKHKNLSKVEADGSLSEDQKNVLRGIHKRHLSYADSPSHEDLHFLNNFYGGVSPSLATSKTPRSASGQPPSPPAAPSNERIKLSDDKNLYFNPLHDAAFSGRNKWYNIGIRLKISVADLESFKTNNPLNVEGCFIAMLNKWFDNNDNCYLDTFLGALRSDSVGLSNLCSKVKEAILAAKRARM